MKEPSTRTACRSVSFGSGPWDQSGTWERSTALQLPGHLRRPGRAGRWGRGGYFRNQLLAQLPQKRLHGMLFPVLGRDCVWCVVRLIGEGFGLEMRDDCRVFDLGLCFGTRLHITLASTLDCPVNQLKSSCAHHYRDQPQDHQSIE